MKIYNKFVESKTAPQNKSDIWFDGSKWNMFKEGKWKPFTLSAEQAIALYNYIEQFELFKIVNELPEVGKNNTIYLIENKDSIEGNRLVEYIYINNTWEEIGNFSPMFVLQADWNQDDENAKDYIKNKPFGEVFKKVEWYVEEEYGDYYYCTEISNQVKINGTVYDISYHEITNIEDIGIGVILVEDGIRVYGVDEEETLELVLVKVTSKINEKYIPDTIARKTDIPAAITPDWNAKEDEAGYIDNKPFGESFKAVEWFYNDGASFCITPMISNKVKYEGVIYEIPDNADENVILADGSIALSKYLYYDDNLMYVVCLGIQDESDERLKRILFKTDVKLNSDNIDDKVIKTTPQILNDTDKNQALSNLGIDPVVWKYICSPFILVFDFTLSDEIHNMIWYKEAGVLNAVILNTAQVLYNGQYYRVNKLISTNRLGIITSDGEVIYEYDNEIRQFKIVE